MNAKPVFRENSEVKVHSSVARQILIPSGDNPLQPDAYGELRYELEGDTVFFTFNAQGLEGGNYYGLYSGNRLLGLGYAVKSSKLNIQGFRPSEIMEGRDFRLFSMKMDAISPLERIL
jgi:hypothetical protein